MGHVHRWHFFASWPELMEESETKFLQLTADSETEVQAAGEIGEPPQRVRFAKTAFGETFFPNGYFFAVVVNFKIFLPPFNAFLDLHNRSTHKKKFLKRERSAKRVQFVDCKNNHKGESTLV